MQNLYKAFYANQNDVFLPDRADKRSKNDSMKRVVVVLSRNHAEESATNKFRSKFVCAAFEIVVDHHLEYFVPFPVLHRNDVLDQNVTLINHRQ